MPAGFWMDIEQLSRSKVLLNQQEGQEPMELSKQQALAELMACEHSHKILVVVQRMRTAVTHYTMLRRNRHCPKSLLISVLLLLLAS